MMTISRCALVSTAIALLASTAAAGQGGAPGRTAALPADRWVLKDSLKTKSKMFAAAVYMPATDEFLLWGLPDDRFEVETFSAREGRWKNVTPPQGLPDFPKGMRSDVDIELTAGTTVAFASAGGVERPTRAMTFHQVTYDTKRDRVLFYLGGRTFSYDPKTRLWHNLEPKQSPVACQGLTWASLCYDPVNDEAVLFGGGLALNAWGGAYTWLYDCKENTWRALEQPRGEQPPLRCVSQMACDAKNKVIVLAGGHAQSRLLADTWVYDLTKRRWSERKPKLCPPPAECVAMAYVASRGQILYCAGMDQTWSYDAAADRWTRLKGDLGLGRSDYPQQSTSFLSCSYSTADDVVLLLGSGTRPWDNVRRTWLCRLDPATATHPEQKGARPGDTAEPHPLKYVPESTVTAAERSAHEKWLAELPANTMVEVKPPVSVPHRTWSTADIDTKRGRVIYTGGGHSGYCGTDWAYYDVGANRWSMCWPPERAPYCWGYSGKPLGWSYGRQPWAIHNRHILKYDPQGDKYVYLDPYARNADRCQMLLTDDYRDAFDYSLEAKGGWQFTFDPAAGKLTGPEFGQPLSGHPAGALVGFIGTPHGLSAALWAGGLYQGTLKDGRYAWTRLTQEVPPKFGQWEVHPMAYDSRRDRLLVVQGTGGAFRSKEKEPDVTRIFAYPFKTGKWEEIKTTGRSELSRDALYIARHDSVLMLGRDKWLVLDLASNQWRIIDCQMPDGRTVNYGWNLATVYDPVHDVAVVLSTSGGSLRMYLFRYDPKTAKYREENSR